MSGQDWTAANELCPKCHLPVLSGDVDARDPSWVCHCPRGASVAQDHATKLRTYGKQLPTVLSVPNLVRDLFDAADEIDRLNRVIDSLLGKGDDA